MDALLPQRLEFSYDKGKLLRISLICFGFGLLTAGVTFLPDKPGHHPPSAVLMWPAAALCALTACELLWRLFRNRPGLVISPAGVHIATFAAETVPWLAIRTL